MLIRKFPRRALSLAVLALSVAPLCAHESGDAASPSQAGGAGAAHEAGKPTSSLERVEVKAARQSLSTRLPLTRRETPQSISGLDQQRMEQENLLSINDVMRQITGVYVSFYDTQRPLYFARGFQITDFQVDGVPTYSGATNQEYDSALYERVDVLRGANGLLSGPGNPSATVNLQRKRPGKTLEGAATLMLGSWDMRRAELDFGLPLSQDGRVRARLVGVKQQRNSFLDRYSEDKTAYLGVIEADLWAGSTASLGYQNQNNVPRGAIWGTIPRFAADGSLANLPRSTSFAPHWTRWSRQSGTAFASLEQKLGAGWLLKAMFNRTEGNTQSLRVYGSGFPDLRSGAGMSLLAGASQSEDRRDSLDVYAQGPFSLLGRRHDLMMGYSQVKLQSDSAILKPLDKWRYDIPDLARWDGNAPAPTVSPTGARRVGVTEQRGLIASARWRLLEPLSLITGGRLSDWETRTDNYNSSGSFTGSRGAYRVSREFTPYLGLVYAINPQWSAYASKTEIFKPQNARDKNDELLAPVQGSNTELGLKADLLDQRLSLSAALFQTRQDNYAVRDLSVPKNFKLLDGSDPQIGVNGTRSEGFELDLSARLSPGWTLNAGYAQTRTHRHEDDQIYANVPRHQVQLSSHWQLPGAWDRLSLGGGLNWQSEVTGVGIEHPILETVTVKEAGFALVSLHANLRLSERFSLGLSVRNALDHSYWANLDYPNYGEPRNFMLSLRGHL